MTVVAVCLVGLGGGVRLLMEPSNSPPSRAAESAARKKPVTRSAATAPAPSGPFGRQVRVIPTDPTPVATIGRSEPEPLVVRPPSRAFGDVQRASGSAYQGFRVVAGR